MSEVTRKGFVNIVGRIPVAVDAMICFSASLGELDEIKHVQAREDKIVRGPYTAHVRGKWLIGKSDLQNTSELLTIVNDRPGVM